MGSVSNVLLIWLSVQILVLNLTWSKSVLLRNHDVQRNSSSSRNNSIVPLQYEDGTTRNTQSETMERHLSPKRTQCKQKSQCEDLVDNVTSCFGVVLPYKKTSISHVPELSSQTEAQRQLHLWQALRHVPRCWSVVQPLLCAVYMPRCEQDLVDLPSDELCRITRGPCRIVETTQGWPEFLKCENEQYFSTHCKNDWRELKFNSSSHCPFPLVDTDQSNSWLDGIEGCAMPCYSPLYTKDEHHSIQMFVGVLGSICLACCLFTVLTFFIDWKSANKYPALIIFYINSCYVVACIGWLAQFTPGAKEDIICRKDGTLRVREPSSGENLSCVIIFVMVYYFLMAAVIWFVLLTYSWFVAFRSLGKVREAMEARTAYFHLIAWSLPLVMTIATLALGQVDGDSVSGICFVGYNNQWMRIGFLLVPILVSGSIGGFFLIRGLIILVHLKLDGSEIIKEKANTKIRETILRIGSFLVLACSFVLTTFICHFYEYTNQEEWQTSFRDFLLCEALRSVQMEKRCTMKHRPSATLAQLHLFTVFASGVLMSSWIWTESTTDAWKRFIRKIFRQPINEPVKLKKHKMIAKAFARRHQIHNGHLSISFNSTHDDPLGMNFDLNSIASQEMSSTWAANVSKFVTRRGALMGAGALGLRRNSSASEDAGRRGSLEIGGSRRHSLDSQISMHLSEQERLSYLTQARQQRRRKRKEFKLRNRRSRIVPCNLSRETNTSQNNLPQMKINNLNDNHNNAVPSSNAAISLPGQILSYPEGDCHSVTDNESVRNFGEHLSDAIMMAVWGSHTSLDKKSEKVDLAQTETVHPSRQASLPSRQASLPSRQASLPSRQASHPSRQASVAEETKPSNQPVNVPNNLRQFPLLSRTAIDIDGDSDARESSSS